MLPAMELRQLRHFVAVAEEGNISRAAKKCFLTQPALSRQIKALEEEIGHCLLERQAHSIRLTAAGTLLVEEARELLDRAEQLLERVRRIGHGVSLRVGYAPSLAAGMLATAINSFTQTHPNARVELFDLATTEMLDWLDADKLDVAVMVEWRRSSRGLAWTPLTSAPWRLAVHRDHPLARRKAILPREVAGAPLLVFCQRDYPEYRELITRWLREHRLRPRFSGEHDGVDSLLAAVESGLGVAMVTTRMADRVPPRIHLLELASAPEPLSIAAACREERKAEKPLGVFIQELCRASASR